MAGEEGLCKSVSGKGEHISRSLSVGLWTSVEMDTRCGLFRISANLVQATEWQQLPLMEQGVFHRASRWLDLEASVPCAAHGFRQARVQRRQSNHLVRLVALGHALSNPHADTEQVCLHLFWHDRREALSSRVLLVLLLLLLLGASSVSLQALAAPQITVVKVVRGKEAGDGRLELEPSLILMLFGRCVCGAMLHGQEQESGGVLGGTMRADISGLLWCPALRGGDVSDATNECTGQLSWGWNQTWADRLPFANERGGKEGEEGER